MKQILTLEGRSNIAITSEYERHLNFLGKPFPGLNGIAGRLHNDHVYLLENYGAWMEALVNNTIQPLTEAQRRFVEVANGDRNEATRFEKAWTNLLIAKNRNRTDLIRREIQLSTRVSNVGSFPNSKTIHNVHSSSDGSFGFITGIVLAVLAFSIVPVIPVIVAFFAGHWVNYTFGKK